MGFQQPTHGALQDSVSLVCDAINPTRPTRRFDFQPVAPMMLMKQGTDAGKVSRPKPVTFRSRNKPQFDAASFKHFRSYQRVRFPVLHLDTGSFRLCVDR